jgi:hypothetical protein
MSTTLPSTKVPRAIWTAHTRVMEKILADGIELSAYGDGQTPKIT